MEATRLGDPVAFSELLSVYRPLVLSQTERYAALVDRDDLMQDASLALYRAALRYRGDAGTTFGAFARVCISHALISTLRKGSALTEAVSLPEELPFKGEEPVERLIERETVTDLYKLAEECLSDYENAVFLRYIHGYTPRAIAQEVGRSEKSVSNAIARMLKKLRARLI
ncbi:MAG: sigma-70 family RNA polymerase sigma factor [Clostridia bacterium]|nr:sigma-70 family RNA polymerase sigma factor [Clostridia bacterium]